MESAVNLASKLSLVDSLWSPRVIAMFNSYEIMVVRVEGEFLWHSHPETDDFFLVLEGTLEVELRERTVTVAAGEIFVVPRGIEHRTAARCGEVKMLLIEPRGTPNTGDPKTAATKLSL